MSQDFDAENTTVLPFLRTVSVTGLAKIFHEEAKLSYPEMQGWTTFDEALMEKFFPLEQEV